MNDNFKTATAADIAMIVRRQQCDLKTAISLITSYGEIQSIKGRLQFADALERIMQPLRGARS